MAEAVTTRPPPVVGLVGPLHRSRRPSNAAGTTSGARMIPCRTTSGRGNRPMRCCPSPGKQMGAAAPRLAASLGLGCRLGQPRVPSGRSPHHSARHHAEQRWHDTPLPRTEVTRWAVPKLEWVDTSGAVMFVVLRSGARLRRAARVGSDLDRRSNTTSQRAASSPQRYPQVWTVLRSARSPGRGNEKGLLRPWAMTHQRSGPLAPPR